MQTITVNFTPNISNYHIHIGENISVKLNNILAQQSTSKQIVIISDTRVAKLYLLPLEQQLASIGYDILALTIRPGERSKTATTKQRLENQMLEHKMNRYALIIALGGGVVGDLAGYIASTYMRGIKFIQLPTTLLAMLDSSVGGKTAINTRYGKNLIGSFYQPAAVVIDINFLRSLPRQQLINGIVEALKIFLTFDAAAFTLLANNLDKLFSLDMQFLLTIIQRAVELKARVVMDDEKEQNLRMALNFGHTVGHALEKVANYKILHGMAVGVGILVEALIAVELDKLSYKDFTIIAQVFASLGIDAKLISGYDVQQIANATLLDKKNSSAKIKCVLIDKIGSIAMNNSSVTSEVELSSILLALKQFKTANQKLKEYL